MNLAFDFETTKVPRHRPWVSGSYPVILTAKSDSGEAYEWVFNHGEIDPPEQLTQRREIQQLVDRSSRLIAHNAKFDIQWLWSIGVELKEKKVFCTQIADYLINGQRKIPYSLEQVSRRRGFPGKIDRVKKFWDADFETDEIPLNILLPYARRDTELVLDIFKQQVQDIHEYKLEKLVGLQMKLMVMLAEMEYTGFLFDVKKAEELYTEYQKKIVLYETELKEIFGVQDLNLNSNQDLSVVLFGGELKRVTEVPTTVMKNVTEKESYLFNYKDPKKKPVVKWRNVKKQVEVEVLKKQPITIPVEGMFNIDNPEDKKYMSVSKNALGCLRPKNKKQEYTLGLLKELSNVSKAAETLRGKAATAGLLNKVEKADGLIHPSFNQTVTRTGRLSGSNPNPQNLPRAGTSPLKILIIPRFGLIGNADLSQIEWRAAIFQSQDPVGMHEILTGIDQHRENAITFFGADPDLPNDHPDFKPIRTTAKVFTFRLLYGGSAYGMYMDNTMPSFSRKKWQEIVEAYSEKYQVLTNWQLDNIQKVHQSGGWLQIPSGRLFYFERFTYPDWNGNYYEPAKIKNYPSQGFATGDITPLAMIKIREQMIEQEIRSQVLLNVHDSIMFDLYEDEVDIVADICVDTFQCLPYFLNEYFGINFNIPLGGEFEVGPNYGDMRRIR